MADSCMMSVEGEVEGPLMIRLLATCVAAAGRAGQLVRAVVESGNLGLVEKGFDDPQTEADRRAQRCVISSILAKFPGLTVIGEETLDPSDEDQKLSTHDQSAEVLAEKCPAHLSAVQEKDVVVWVDPLDGTKEFSKGLLQYPTVLIGIAVGGKAVGGVIHHPFWSPSLTSGSPSNAMATGRTIWGLVGMGVRGLLNPGPASSSSSSNNTDQEKKGLTVITTMSHNNALVDRSVKAVKPGKLVRAGGSGYKILMVLEGEADVYLFPTPGTKKWDTCAGEALLLAMGGTLTDARGDVLDYSHVPGRYLNSLGVVATLDKDTHKTVLDGIPKDVINDLQKMESKY